MILYGLRLLVALLTFAVGVAAAWLLDFKSTPALVEQRVTTVRFIHSSGTPPAELSRGGSLDQPRVVAGGIITGKAVSKPPAVYPPAAKAARVSGTVAVEVEVDEDGNVAKAEAVSGPVLLREAAEDAAREARFTPTRLSGKPVRVSGIITYNFVLN